MSFFLSPSLPLPLSFSLLVVIYPSVHPSSHPTRQFSEQTTGDAVGSSFLSFVCVSVPFGQLLTLSTVIILQLPTNQLVYIYLACFRLAFYLHFFLSFLSFSFLSPLLGCDKTSYFRISNQIYTIRNYFCLLHLALRIHPGTYTPNKSSEKYFIKQGKQF